MSALDALKSWRDLGLHTPWALLLLAPAIWLGLRGLRGMTSRATVRVSDGMQAQTAMVGRRPLRAYLPHLLELAGMALMVLGAARPQLGASYEEILTEGIDIVMALDVSSSMLCEDFRPKNRLEVARSVLKDFVQSRRADRIGLVVFSGKAFTLCPLTLDYPVLLDVVDRVKQGDIEDGTAIGLGIATACNRLREAKGKSKVVVLLTDGVNNRFEIDPLTAGQLARSLGIKIYCIGAGTRGSVPCPVDDPMFGRHYVHQEVEIDEELLKKVAETTGGLYFRATDKESLEEIYKKIGELETTKVEVKQYTRYTEAFPPFALSGLGLWGFAFLLSETWCRVLP
ncbi:MAG: VWA domain-containing protein [Acidobacteriota bacterium]